MQISITAISDPKNLSSYKGEIDAFIDRCNEKPFFLHAFLERQMQTSAINGSKPIMLILKAQEKIVGCLPLVIENKSGVRSTKFLYNYYFSPDFIFEDNYRAACMEASMEFIFCNLKCKFVSFDIPADSPNIFFLQQSCKNNSAPIEIINESNIHHAVIDIRSNWEEFKQSKGKNFSKKMRQIERRLHNTGKCDVEVFENGNKEQEVFNKIIEVEEGCWKNNWRIHNNSIVLADGDLLNIWTGAGLAVKQFPDLKRRVWFLNLDGKPIAYNLAIEYKGTIYMCKTSFNNKYRNLSPGIYLNNISIQDSFNSNSINMIDFLTNLPFHERWTRNRLSRVRFTLSKGVMPNLYGAFAKQARNMKVNERIIGGIKILDNLRRI